MRLGITCLGLLLLYTLQLSGAMAEPDNPPASPELVAKVQKLCKLTDVCNKTHPGKSAYCLKVNLKESGILSHVLEGETAKDLPRFLRREGFMDLEQTSHGFDSLPDGAILVIDAHDPLKDKRPLCPKVYGNIVVKCGDHWIDDQKYDLDFNTTRMCRTKGIWVKPEFLPLAPPPKSGSAPKAAKDSTAPSE